MRSSSQISYKFYKLRLWAGVLFSLPLVLVVLWYAWAAFAQVDRYMRGSSDEAVWSFELFQIALHDELIRDFRRMTQEERPPVSALPTFDISLNRDNLDALNKQLYSNAERSYVHGYIQKDGQIHETKIRYRGTKNWHWIGSQKSIKMRLDRGDLIDGTRIFNLLNDPTPFGLEVPIIFSIARQLDLLTPDYHMARVRLNNSDMGVYHYAAQPVEGVLRRGRRMPGALYSGDTDSLDVERGVGGLFFGREGWQQVTERMVGTAGEYAPLDHLLEAIQHANHAEFVAFSERHIDLQRYAAFDALDVVFGGNEHDYFSNHKLYFDPYRGRFEPVVWGFRGFRHEPAFNLVDHPLLVRLKMVPGYLALRNRIVFDLLTQAASVPQVRMYAAELFAEISPDLATDPHWDSYKLLPRVTRFHRFMVRPMSREKWLLSARVEMLEYGRRARYLLDELEAFEVAGTAYALSPEIVRVDLVVDGHGAETLREVVVGREGSGTFEWRSDFNRNGRLDISDPLLVSGQVATSYVLNSFNELLPGVRLVSRADSLAKRGKVSVDPEARTYSYLIETSEKVSEIVLIFESQASGRSSRLALAVSGEDAPSIQLLPDVHSAPELAAGQRSPHLWDFPMEPPFETVNLGPERVEIDGIRLFLSHQNVVIAAGTQIEMGPHASLVFQGLVTAVGTAKDPIAIVARDAAQPFGGIAVQGPATSGSKFKHLRVEGGTKIGNIGVDYPSLFNIYDTRDILLEHVYFARNTEAEDVLHTTYVDSIRLHEVVVSQAPVDGIDLEFSTGEIRGVRVLGAGDDCLDLMGVDLLIADSVLQDCSNNAISAGEESVLRAHGLFISDSKTGLLAKNDSHARITRSLLYRTDTALQTKRRDVHYTGSSSIGASDLFVVKSARIIDAASQTRIEAGPVHQALPVTGALDHLMRHVLGLSGWGDFSRYAARMEGGKEL